MRNIYSNIFNVNNKNLSKAINCLKKKQLIGVPTETVYGLAGNAYSKKAIKKIYLLKKRPFKNPLIIHYLNLKQLKNDVELNSDFYKLYKKFWDGWGDWLGSFNKKGAVKGNKNAIGGF